MIKPKCSLAWSVILVAAICTVGVRTNVQADEEKGNGRLKIFILAGQSNMVGAGVVKLDPKRNNGKGSLEYFVKNTQPADQFSHMIDETGKWVERDDV